MATDNVTYLARKAALPVDGIDPYIPQAGEEYMSEKQLAHFREILVAWKKSLMEEVDRTVVHMKEEASNFSDPADRATQEEEFALELRTRDRERKLIKKIEYNGNMPAINSSYIGGDMRDPEYKKIRHLSFVNGRLGAGISISIGADGVYPVYIEFYKDEMQRIIIGV